MFRPLHTVSVPRQPVQSSNSCDSPCLSYLQLSGWEPPVTESWTSLNKWQMWKCSAREDSPALPHLTFPAGSLVSFTCHYLQNLFSISDHFHCHADNAGDFCGLIATSVLQLGNLEDWTFPPPPLRWIMRDLEVWSSNQPICAILCIRGRQKRTGTICPGPLHSPRAPAWSGGLLQGPAGCQTLSTVPEGLAGPPQCHLPGAEPFSGCWQGTEEEGVAWRQPGACVPPSDRDRGQRGSGSSARQISLPSDRGGASEQMLFPHHLCHCPALSMPEIHLLPVTVFSIGYSHHQL